MANWVIHDETTALNVIVDDNQPSFPPELGWLSFEATQENIDAYRYLVNMDIFFPLPEPPPA